jgi:hypothetical protein
MKIHTRKLCKLERHSQYYFMRINEESLERFPPHPKA